jgi:putative transposase
VTVAGFAIPEGWSMQAFCFALDPSPEQAACLRRQFGARRHARNWAVRTLKGDLDRYHATGEETEKPSLAGLRKRWNQVKDAECVDAETGEVWWPHISKEAFADGIKAAVDGYWAWQASRAGKRAGKPAGFPRFARKGRDRDRVTFTTGAIRVEPDRRHVTLPRTGAVRVHENTRRLQRLIANGRARILAVTVSRKGTRLIAAFRVLIQRPVQPRAARPASRVGVDVGVRVLATVASPDEVIERVPNPRPLEAALKQLRHLCRERSRRTRGSLRYTQTNTKIARLHRRVAGIRGHHLHVLTTRLAKTHGEIVAEGLDAAAMLRQKGLPGARARRRGLSDSALGEARRQLAYKTGWYGSRLIVADRWYPSSKTCHACGHVQDIGWAEHWTCAGCGTGHQRDDNAAINLARYEEASTAGGSAVGPVRAAVKRRAGRKTGPRPAAGDEARKGTSRQAGEQPRDGVPTR